MRASGASELRKCLHLYILKLLFLSIFCRYFRYFVGTNDMLVGLWNALPSKLRSQENTDLFKSIKDIFIQQRILSFFSPANRECGGEICGTVC